MPRTSLLAWPLAIFLASAASRATLAKRGSSGSKPAAGTSLAAADSHEERSAKIQTEWEPMHSVWILAFEEDADKDAYTVRRCRQHYGVLRVETLDSLDSAAAAAALRSHSLLDKQVYYRQLGFIHEKNGAYEEAISAYRKSVAAVSRNEFSDVVSAQAWWNIGSLLSGSDTPGAINAWEKSLEALDNFICNPMDICDCRDCEVNPGRKRDYIMKARDSLTLKQLRANASKESHQMDDSSSYWKIH